MRRTAGRPVGAVVRASPQLYDYPMAKLGGIKENVTFADTVTLMQKSLHY